MQPLKVVMNSIEDNVWKVKWPVKKTQENLENFAYCKRSGQEYLLNICHQPLGEKSARFQLE